MHRFLLVLTGPTGAGKSAVAALLAKGFDNCVNIDVDHVKHFVVKPFIYDDSAEGMTQWKLLGENLGLLAKKYHSNGYNIVINGYVNEAALIELSRHVAPTHKILLLPSIDSLNKRDVLRPKDYQMGGEAVVTHHSYFSSENAFADFIRIDTSHHSVDETVDGVKRMLQREI